MEKILIASANLATLAATNCTDSQSVFEFSKEADFILPKINPYKQKACKRGKFKRRNKK